MSFNAPERNLNINLLRMSFHPLLRVVLFGVDRREMIDRVARGVLGNFELVVVVVALQLSKRRDTREEAEKKNVRRGCGHSVMSYDSLARMWEVVSRRAGKNSEQEQHAKSPRVMMIRRGAKHEGSLA